MAHMHQESKPGKAISRRPRRSFTDEFKAGAVRLVLDQGKSVSATARDLDLTASALQAWVNQARARSLQGQDRPHLRGARGAHEAAQAGPGAHDGARHLKRSRSHLREAPAVKFDFIAAKMTELPITVLCRALGVSRSGFYVSVDRPPSVHAVEDTKLAVLVRAAHERSRRRYGAPRVQWS